MENSVLIDFQGGIFVSILDIGGKPVRGAAGCLDHVRAWADRSGRDVRYSDAATLKIKSLPVLG